MSDTRMNLKLKMMLLEKNIPQIKVAKTIKIDNTRFSRIIRGWEIPTAKIRKDIARFLKVKESAIFN